MIRDTFEVSDISSGTLVCLNDEIGKNVSLRFVAAGIRLVAEPGQGHLRFEDVIGTFVIGIMWRMPLPWSALPHAASDVKELTTSFWKPGPAVIPTRQSWELRAVFTKEYVEQFATWPGATIEAYVEFEPVMSESGV